MRYILCSQHRPIGPNKWNTNYVRPFSEIHLRRNRYRARKSKLLNLIHVKNVCTIPNSRSYILHKSTQSVYTLSTWTVFAGKVKPTRSSFSVSNSRFDAIQAWLRIGVVWSQVCKWCRQLPKRCRSNIQYYIRIHYYTIYNTMYVCIYSWVAFLLVNFDE